MRLRTRPERERRKSQVILVAAEDGRASWKMPVKDRQDLPGRAGVGVGGGRAACPRHRAREGNQGAHPSGAHAANAHCVPGTVRGPGTRAETSRDHKHWAGVKKKEGITQGTWKSLSHPSGPTRSWRKMAPHRD